MVFVEFIVCAFIVGLFTCLFSYEDEIMQGNFADQTLFTPAKPTAVQSLQTETNDTLQDLELSDLEHSALNLTDESKSDLETPSKEEVSFENIPERSESPDPIIAQQETADSPVQSEVQETIIPSVVPSESPEPEPSVQEPNEPKIEEVENRNDSPVESTPEPDEEIIEENVITDTDSLKNEITESDIRKVAEDLIDKTLDNVEQKLKVKK